jgi:YesN/AraC family two-component response regulator
MIWLGGNRALKTNLERVFAAGYGSYSQFYQIFKKSYGYGPREYLKGG